MATIKKSEFKAIILECMLEEGDGRKKVDKKIKEILKLRKDLSDKIFNLWKETEDDDFTDIDGEDWTKARKQLLTLHDEFMFNKKFDETIKLLQRGKFQNRSKK